MMRTRPAFLAIATAAVAVTITVTPQALAATELFLPVASRSEGFADTRWRTRLWVVAGSQATDVVFEYYPTSTGGLSGPAAVASRSLSSGTQLYIEDLLGDLWGVNGTGAVRLLATAPIAAFARVVNTKMPAVFEGGTFGQAMPAMTANGLSAVGVLPGLSNERISDESGFRCNIGWFNPGPTAATLTARVVTAGGEVLGERNLQIPPLSQWLGSVFDVIWTVPQDQRELQHFVVAYEVVGGPLFVYASVIDNITGDAVTVLPLPAP